MLRITLDYIPFGYEKKKKTIGTLEISNVSGNATSADYDYIIKGNISHMAVADEHKGKIYNYPRMKGAWRLVKACLDHAFNGEIFD